MLDLSHKETGTARLYPHDGPFARYPDDALELVLPPQRVHLPEQSELGRDSPNINWSQTHLDFAN
ncbi:MAG: hypothetical protein CMG46_04420 [Candidatus Marinimicrobia bacterium]|nr:hypothetical protein [Candidatus Neomarinimicrobiota bacterium]